MATSTISLGKVKFTWKGDWVGSTAYKKDDVVKYGPSVYVCLTAHTSVSDFVTNESKWDLMVAGLENAGTWSSVTLYKTGQTVTYGGAVYIALRENTNANPYTSAADWQKFVDGQQFEGDWNTGTDYQKGDIVSYGGYLYVAKQNTTANNPTNTVYWDVYSKGFEYIGLWNVATQYKPGDVVQYGGNRYVVREGRRPLSPRPTDTTEYQEILQGFNWKGDWLSTVEYLPNDIVKYGPKLYRVKNLVQGQRPDQDTANFELFSDGIGFQGVYSNNNEYQKGDIVTQGGRTYICIESYENDGSTTPEPANSDFWQVFADGFKWEGSWSNLTEYKINDVVEYSQSSYISLTDDNQNNVPGSSPSNWSLLAQGDSNAVLTTRGDIIFRDATQTTRLGIGPAGSFLVSDGNEPKWGHLTPQQDYFVSPNGDDSNDGRTAVTSWKTIRHACEQTFNIGQCRINVQAGTYTEQCPIRVGRSVVLEGNGLGAVTISPDTTNDNGFGVGISDDGSTPNANSNLFLMNNGCRLRNFVFRNFSTGSVIVSLDPGTGPDDTNVWITSQSPYVQNCTSFTPGGTGFKIDGGLHNGGYKSMVANDWTQINSDGVGVHVLNDGRTEIVSCFTYYCDIGYLAESGGKIRAIVGNNSYGEYGAVARGFSQAETPLTGKLRLNSDTINSVIQLASNMHVFTAYRDINGNRFMVGHTNPTGTDVTSSWNNASSYPVIVKYNAAGSLDWLYTYESTFGAIHSAIEVSDRIFCGGVVYDGGTNKAFIMAISKAGEFQWQKTIGSMSEIVDLATNGDQLFAIGNHNTEGVGITKLSVTGIEQWSRTLSYNDSTNANTLVPTACTFAGTPTTSVDTYTLAGDSTAEDNLYVASYDTTNTMSYITRFDENGNYINNYEYGDIRINSLDLDTGNGDGIYLMAAGWYDAGAVNKNPIAFRLDVDGTVNWQKQFNLSAEEGEFKDVIALGNDVYLSGYFNDGTNNNNTGLIVRMGSNGNTVNWAVQIENGTNNIALNGIMLDGVNVISAGIEQGNGIIVNVQRDQTNGIGTVTSGSYTYTNSSTGQTTNTVVQRQIQGMESTNVSYGTADTTLTLNQSPSQSPTVVATRLGFAGIGRGTSFTIDSLNRQPKDGSVLQISGDTETYFVISVASFVAKTAAPGNAPNAKNILTQNRAFLQEEVVQYINTTYPSFVYNEATCRRDVGLIVDALAIDVDENSNGNSIDAGYEYYSNASGLVAITTQKAETVAAITYLKSIVDDVLNQTAPPATYGSVSQVTGLGATESGTVLLTENNTQAIIDIINNGQNGGPAKTNYGTCTIGIDPAIPSNKTPNDITHVTFREAFSQVRMSGHDFLDIGTGGFADTNYPVIIATDYTQAPDQTREVKVENGGRVFYVTTDQDGNFRVGDYFKVEQATGRATLSSEEFDLAGLNELQLGSITAGKQGATINEFSTDGTFADNSDQAVPTERATKTYIDQQITNLSATQGTIVAGVAPNQSKVEVTGSGQATDTIDFDINGTQVATFKETAFEIDTTGHLLVPKGTTAQRPGSPTDGYFRYNTDIGAFEGYSNSQWSGVGGGNPWITKNNTDSPYTAVNNDRIFVDTSTAGVIINLPASPNTGDRVQIIDVAGTANTNNITVGRNGENIMALAQDMVIDENNSGFALLYSGATYGWVLEEV